MNYLEALKNKKRLPHVLPLLPKGQNNPTPCTAKTAKSPFDSRDSTIGRHISENRRFAGPPPEPVNLGPVYDRLWAEAWTHADWIGGDSAPYADRVARLPELLAMQDRLAKREQTGAHPPGNILEPAKQATYSAVLKEKDASSDTCPARCKQTGRCYGKAFFIGKPGKSQGCTEPCSFSDQFEIRIKNEKESQR